MAQSLLKPGILGPTPILLGEIHVMVEAAVHLALQQYQLPIARTAFMNVSSHDELFE